MKLFKLLILFLSFNLSAQNLVPNYSFENCDLNGWLNSGLLAGQIVPDFGLYSENDLLYPDLNDYQQLELYWSYMNSWELPLRRYPWCVNGPHLRI
jgi:hypothetical protein